MHDICSKFAQNAKPTEKYNTQRWEDSNDIIKIEETVVISAIDEMSSNSVPDPDGFSEILLKKNESAPARPLQILFRSFVATEKLPK